MLLFLFGFVDFLLFVFFLLLLLLCDGQVFQMAQVDCN